MMKAVAARKLSANRLSLDIGVPSGRITDIYDITVVEREKDEEIAKRVRPADAA